MLILANATEANKRRITVLLHAQGVKTEKSGEAAARRWNGVPVAADLRSGLAESERMLPGMINRIEKLCGEVGLTNEEIIIRSTGCPNGCARPYVAEIAFVGKARDAIKSGWAAACRHTAQPHPERCDQGSGFGNRAAPGARCASPKKSTTATNVFGDRGDRVFLKEPPTAMN